MCFEEEIFTQSLLEDVERLYKDADPAHDFSHILRVYHNAKVIGLAEGADIPVLLLAALLHDAKEGSKHSLNGIWTIFTKSSSGWNPECIPGEEKRWQAGEMRC